MNYPSWAHQITNGKIMDYFMLNETRAEFSTTVTKPENGEEK